MTTDIINSTSWQECLIYDYQNYIICSLIVLVTVVIMYFPIFMLLFIWYSSSISLFIYKKVYNLPEDIYQDEWDRLMHFLASMMNMVAKVLHGIESNKKIWRLLKTREQCVEILKEGYLLGIAPGGLREQNYGDNTYRLVWGKRKGFAQVAIDAKVPIIPMFTQNIREAYRTCGNIWPMRWLYEKTRFLIFPAFGPIPVKLRTHIGEPIPYDPNITAEELAEKTKTAIEALRDKHQKIPGCIRRALWERFEKHHKAG